MMSGNNASRFGQAAGWGGIGAGVGSLLFGGMNNPADAADPYLSQIQGQISPYYQPYIGAGTQSLSALQGQYGDLINNPGGMLNKIGGSFQQSPGFQFALQQALRGANQGAAAGGMAGSPQSQVQNMQIGTQLGNKDYYNYLGDATGLYGQGLQGLQGLTGLGFNAASGMSDQIAQMLAARAQLAYQGQAAQNQQQNSMFGNIANGAGMLAAFGGG